MWSRQVLYKYLSKHIKEFYNLVMGLVVDIHTFQHAFLIVYKHIFSFLNI